MHAELVTTDGARVTLRPATATDEAFLRHLDADRRAPQLAGLGWPEPALHSLLDLQFRAQQQGYRVAYPDADHWIVLDGPTPAGRLLLDRGPDEHRLVDVAVLTGCRGRGIGTAVLREVVAAAADADVPLRLTVAAFDTRLIAWYRRLGFHAAGRGDVGLRMVAGG